MTDHTIAVVGLYVAITEALLLVWVVVQGEYIRFYEKAVHTLHLKREEELMSYREKKRKERTKKSEPVPSATKGDQDL